MKPVPTATLAARYAAGAGLNQLAREYPLCRTAILYRLKRAGVVMRPTGAPQGNTNAGGRRPEL